jgi:thiol-disulfide isomerase/thioredoxin
MHRVALLAPVLAVIACATGAQPRPLPTSARQLVTPPLCGHRVPEAECVLHHPELAAQFQARGDWCPEHAVPESQCLECHPGLRFVVLPPLPPDADLRHVSTMGEDVPDLAIHAAPGKVTVFEFFAAWCETCRLVDAHLHALLADGRDVAVRKLNVMSWESPLAKRYLAKVPSLPYVVVYGKDGRVVRELSGVDAGALDAAVAEGAAR